MILVFLRQVSDGCFVDSGRCSCSTSYAYVSALVEVVRRVSALAVHDQKHWAAFEYHDSDESNGGVLAQK